MHFTRAAGKAALAYREAGKAVRTPEGWSKAVQMSRELLVLYDVDGREIRRLHFLGSPFPEDRELLLWWVGCLGNERLAA